MSSMDATRTNPPNASALKPGTRAERGFAVQRAAVDQAARTVELAFASEQPYERYWGIEVLDCAPTSIRMGRLTSGAPLLWNHDTDEQIGVVESVTVGADRVVRAIVRFGKSAEAEEIFVDVCDGVIRNVSVGYLIHSATLVEKGDAADTYRVTDWEPYEVSLVSVPADPTVGIGRAAGEEDPRTAAPAPAAISTAAAQAATPTIASTPETRTMSTTDTPVAQPAAPALNLSAAVAEATAAERQRQRDLDTLGEQFKRFNGIEICRKVANEGGTVDTARGLIMNAMASAQTEQVTNLGMSNNEQRRFSVFKAIRALTSKDWKGAEFERECHAAILKRAGLEEAPHQGFYVPMDIQQRDLTVGTATAGGNLVATELRPQNFIDLLRARAVVAQMGATMLPGLVGNVAIPKQTGAATAYWLANEAAAITESQQTFGQLALTPKTLGAYTELSRLLMLQSTPAAEALVMADLAKQLALAIDLAALEGSGASGQPTGISNTAGIGSVTGTSLAYAGIIEFQTDLASGNALTPNCGYVTTPAVAGLLAQRQRFSSTDTPLWTGSVLDGQMAGFKAATTTQVTAASMVFGDFEQVVIGEWGFLELALNPYANFAAAITGIRAIQTLDVGIRQAAAFSRATSIT